jgi:hypothetical protein
MKIIGIVLTIILAAIAIIAYFTVQKFMHDTAVDGCLQAGRLEFTNEQGLLANTPDDYWFRDCMERKGYKGETLN